MSRGALKELLRASPEKFNIMIKNVPKSEKSDILKFLKERSALWENLQ